MKIGDIRYHHPNGNNFECEVEFGQTIKLTMVNEQLANTTVVTFDRDSFRPLRDEWSTPTGRNNYANDIKRVIPEGEDCLEFTRTQDNQERDKVGSVYVTTEKDFGKVYEVWYRILEEALQRMPQSGSKIMLSRKFSQAAKEIGYVGEAREYGNFLT